MDECRQQMKFERWDCSHSGTILHEPAITKHCNILFNFRVINLSL